MKRVYGHLKRLLIPQPMDKAAATVDEAAILRSKAAFLCLVTTFLMLFAASINLYDDSYHIVTPLCVTAIVPFVGLIWLRRKGNGLAPILCTCFSLIILSSILIARYNIADVGNLVWYMLFPPLVMFCAGLRWGTLLLAIFFIQLFVFLLAPPALGLAPDVAPMLKVRFLVAMFGTMLFSWLTEYIRHNTHCALTGAMRRLKRDSLLDPLTGLGNRRSFMLFFNWVESRAKREQRPYALALIDIDNFKYINDVHGHQAGDAVLRHCVRILLANQRTTDKLFRWGGDEFLLLMPETDASEATVVLERLRRSIENAPCLDRNIHIAYTVSIGVYVGDTGQTLEEQLLKVDRNLYAAKEAGRNRVVGR